MQNLSKMQFSLFSPYSYCPSMLSHNLEDKIQIPWDGIQRAPRSSSGHLFSLMSWYLTTHISLIVLCFSLFRTSAGSCQHCSHFSLCWKSLPFLISYLKSLFLYRFHLYFCFKITSSYCNTVIP